MTTPRAYSAMEGVDTMLLLRSILPCLRWRLSWRPFPAGRIRGGAYWPCCFCCALAIDTVFCGGSGVDINGFFVRCWRWPCSAASLGGVGQPALGPIQPSLADAAGAIFFLGLALPMVHSGNARPDKTFAANREAARRFGCGGGLSARAARPCHLREHVALRLCRQALSLRSFNATRFIGAGKLDPGVMIDRIKDHAYGAIQMYNERRPEARRSEPQMSFTIPILQAIDKYYTPGLENEDGVIYLPKTIGTAASLKGFGEAGSAGLTARRIIRSTRNPATPAKKTAHANTPARG